MAKLRNFACYRDYKRAYTRFSKYKNLCYVRSRPHNRISRYTGGTQEKYQYNVHLMPAMDFLQIRDAALESARQTANRALESVLGKTGYFMQMRVYPHHILRENPLASGAGADRLSTGMAHNYGKPIGIAAQIKRGQPIFTVKTNKDNLPLARKAMKRASYKLPCHCSIMVEEINKPAPKTLKGTKTATKEAKTAAPKAVAKASA
ncbi:50S ribosomal protein L16 [Candidatus Woesearchaeota archaeon]|nr:50S ribosomal protein L16 [Candidatus Woesearchaeota archaeon]